MITNEVAAQPSRGRADLVCMQFAAESRLDGSETIGRWRLPADGNPPHGLNPHSNMTAPPLDDKKVRLVACALPSQPWQPGVQHKVAKETGLSLRETKRAITQLIIRGDFNNQINGVVFDKNRVIVAIDHERSNTSQNIGDIYSDALQESPDGERTLM